MDGSSACQHPRPFQPISMDSRPYLYCLLRCSLQGDSVIKLDISPPPAPNGVASLRRRAQDPLPPPGKLNISVVQGLKQQVCDFWSSSAAKYSHQSVRFARGWRPASIRLSVSTFKSPWHLVHG